MSCFVGRYWISRPVFFCLFVSGLRRNRPIAEASLFVFLESPSGLSSRRSLLRSHRSLSSDSLSSSQALCCLCLFFGCACPYRHVLVPQPLDCLSASRREFRWVRRWAQLHPRHLSLYFGLCRGHRITRASGAAGSASPWRPRGEPCVLR